jgi:hypothetical protein
MRHVAKTSQKLLVKEPPAGMITDLKANSKKTDKVKHRESTMAEDPPPRIDPNQVVEIVSSYVRHHQIAADQLAGLIVEVHRALADLGRAP